jgi:hypothetical protein
MDKEADLTCICSRPITSRAILRYRKKSAIALDLPVLSQIPRSMRTNSNGFLRILSCDVSLE